MNILALELSSRRGSLAVLSDVDLLAECEISEEVRRGRGLFRVLPELCERAGVDLESLDLLVPGRGPGAYTGLRLAMTVAQALALPGRRPVFPVSSGEALAWEIAGERSARLVVVMDDARRGKLWMGLFEQTPDALENRLPWTLATPEEAARLVPRDAVVVSPNWTGLSARPEFAPIRHARWIEEDRSPHARWVGALAWSRYSKGLPAEPATPIYMHPAVATTRSA
ncbi:MAG: tRNA (adenosine(37)-N6)-threonylcarbamoyltransferase complex dimerization subunit type 1 TsaB [Verrucomicrobia bacterium]|nr:tRNA (adenosine(37)-N6)-threonylcarbamoyltransferase complex dimerization subunit type 1 TsaB [Verrucomicrobiota bacterium]